MELMIRITNPVYWPNDAIINAWLAAVNNDKDALFDALERCEVIDTVDIPDGRFRRILDQINEKVI